MSRRLSGLLRSFRCVSRGLANGKVGGWGGGGVYCLLSSNDETTGK